MVAIKRIAETKIVDQFTVTIDHISAGKGYFRVTYGEHTRAFASWRDAVCEFEQCVRHAMRYC